VIELGSYRPRGASRCRLHWEIVAQRTLLGRVAAGSTRHTPGKFIAILWIRYLCPRISQFQGKAPSLLWMGQPQQYQIPILKRSSRHRPDERRCPETTSLSTRASAADMATLCDEQGRGTITNRAPMTVCYCGFPGFSVFTISNSVLVPALQRNPFDG
jgi:hypothetical protein